MRPALVALTVAIGALAALLSAARCCRGPAALVGVAGARGWWPLVGARQPPPSPPPRRGVLPPHEAVAALAAPLVEAPPGRGPPLVRTLSVGVVTADGGTQTYHFGSVAAEVGGRGGGGGEDGREGSAGHGGGGSGTGATPRPACTPAASPPTDATIYELGSITKAFTGLLAVTAASRVPTLSLDTPVNDLLPRGVGLRGPRGRRVTLRHLLTHTGGLPRDAPRRRRPPASAARAAAAPDGDGPAPTNYTVDHLYGVLPTVDLPRVGLRAALCGGGAPPRYSNFGVGLAGHALGRAVGAPSYAAALSEAVLRPLGLGSTSIGGPSPDADPAPATAAAPVTADGRPAPEHRMTDARAGAGGLRASVGDAVRWAAFCLAAARGE